MFTPGLCAWCSVGRHQAHEHPEAVEKTLLNVYMCGFTSPLQPLSLQKVEETITGCFFSWHLLTTSAFPICFQLRQHSVKSFLNFIIDCSVHNEESESEECWSSAHSFFLIWPEFSFLEQCHSFMVGLSLYLNIHGSTFSQTGKS